MKKFNYNLPGKVYYVIFSDDKLSLSIWKCNARARWDLPNFYCADYRHCFELFKALLKLKRKGYKIEYYEYSEKNIKKILRKLQNILIKKSIAEYPEYKKYVTKNEYYKNVKKLYSSS
jgi:hypothetical protein